MAGLYPSATTRGERGGRCLVRYGQRRDVCALHDHRRLHPDPRPVRRVPPGPPRRLRRPVGVATSRPTSRCCRRRRSTRRRMPPSSVTARSVASAHAAFDVVLRGTGTFRPLSDVVFIQVAQGVSACEALEIELRGGPVLRELDFYYHPHVTVAHNVGRGRARPRVRRARRLLGRVPGAAPSISTRWATDARVAPGPRVRAVGGLMRVGVPAGASTRLKTDPGVVGVAALRERQR